MKSNLLPRKHFPYYAEALVQQAPSILIITADRSSFEYLKHLKTICVFCPKPAGFYDFSFCAFQEVWVLYSSDSQFQHAMNLAHAIQAAGAHALM